MSCKRLPRTGGIKKLKLKARQRNFMQTVIKSLVMACLFLFLSASFARAQEITAIDLTVICSVKSFPTVRLWALTTS